MIACKHGAYLSLSHAFFLLGFVHVACHHLLTFRHAFKMHAEVLSLQSQAMAKEDKDRAGNERAKVKAEQRTKSCKGKKKGGAITKAKQQRVKTAYQVAVNDQNLLYYDCHLTLSPSWAACKRLTGRNVSLCVKFMNSCSHAALLR